MTSARVSRNDPCPCGSGLKYKRCCEERDVAKPQKSGTLTFMLLALLIAGGAAAVVISLARGGSDKTPSRGRVWSAEHGHWHDAPVPGRSTRRFPLEQPAAASSTPGAPPPGTPPPGKVWSAEHGHWHDAVQPGVTPGAPPPVAITVSPQ